MLSEIWGQIVWTKKKIRGKNQYRILPTIPDYSFKKALRDVNLQQWNYTRHWIDSAIKTAFSIIKSWKKNYMRGKRTRTQPVVKRFFARVKQTQLKLEGELLRISIKPREFVYIDLSKRYFSLDGVLGEPVLTTTHIHLPIYHHRPQPKKEIKIGWDANKYSLDGFSPQLGWIRIDLKPLHTLHITYDNKQRRMNKLASKKKRLGRKLRKKYRNREGNRVDQLLHRITNEMVRLASMHGFEDLDKLRMMKKWRRRWNRELSHTDWQKIMSQVEYKSYANFVLPYYTSKQCSRCGWLRKDLKGTLFECGKCSLRIDRQLNAAINVYLRMEGLPHDKLWFDQQVTPVVVGGFTQTGAKWKEIDELARSPHDTMKPKFAVATPFLHVKVRIAT
jgi:putative transposase